MLHSCTHLQNDTRKGMHHPGGRKGAILRWHCFCSASGKLESKGKHCSSLRLSFGRDPILLSTGAVP